jgi:hypothetical protein
MIVFNCNISSYRVRPLIWSYRWILRIFNGTNNKHEKVSQFWLAKSSAIFSNYSAKKWNTVQKNEIQCQKVKHSAKKWNTVQKSEIRCKKMKYSAKKWNTVQKNEIQCKKMKYSEKKWNTVQKNEIQCMFFSQIALETILLLPIQMLNKFWRPITRNCMQQQIL